MNRNVIIIMIDGGRWDRALNSKIFQSLKSHSVCLLQPITYAPHTIAAMHAVFSGTYGTRTGTNSYYSTFKFKKDKFKTLTEYLNELNYYTHSDAINRLVIPKQGFDKHIVHDEENDDLLERHIDIIHEVNVMSKKHKNFFPIFQSLLMKITKSGTINKKTASRKISKISKRISN